MPNGSRAPFATDWPHAPRDRTIRRHCRVVSGSGRGSVDRKCSGTDRGVWFVPWVGEGRRTTMPSAEHQVTFARPVAEVFTFVADGLNGPKWRPGVLDIALVSGSGGGSVYRQGVKGPGGRRIAADYEVTAYEPNRRLAFRTIAGPVRPTGEVRFDETAGGSPRTI